MPRKKGGTLVYVALDVQRAYAAKMPKKRTSGPSGYKPEHEANRSSKGRITLRVAEDVAETFAELAEEDGTTKAEAFTTLVTNERARRDRRR
jgi:hypothetical protein